MPCGRIRGAAFRAIAYDRGQIFSDFRAVVSAINILLSYVVASPSSRLGQRLVLFASISIACLVVGVLLLKTVTIVGVVLVCASLLLNWFVVRPVQKRLREHDVR